MFTASLPAFIQVSNQANTEKGQEYNQHQQFCILAYASSFAIATQTLLKAEITKCKTGWKDSKSQHKAVLSHVDCEFLCLHTIKPSEPINLVMQHHGS